MSVSPPEQANGSDLRRLASQRNRRRTMTKFVGMGPTAKIRGRMLGFAASLGLAASSISANAAPLLSPPAGFTEAISLRAEPVAARRTVAARGPHGNVAVRTTVVRPGGHPTHPIARPGVRPVHPIARPGHPWVRPPYYTWRPGGAIAAGAALGFVAAASVGAYAGVAPAPGYCWYYTDVTRTQGFGTSVHNGDSSASALASTKVANEG